MQKNKLLLLIVGSMFISCVENDYPDPLWDPNDAGETAPIITALDPPNIAYDGITNITITGENFSPISSENQVTFNGKVATIDSSTNLTTQLVVSLPVVITDPNVNVLDSVKVIVGVQGAYAGAVYDKNFTIERAVIEWGGFVGELPLKEPNAIACDAGENVYVAASDKIMYKIDSTGVRSEFGTGLGSSTSDMKTGPGGYVYFARSNPYLNRVDPTGGVATRFANLKVGRKIRCFDFDSDQNIYCAGSSDSLYLVNVINETKRAVTPRAEGYDFVALRVYDGYVYLAGTFADIDTTQGIWRHKIMTGEDTLGTRELVYDWSDCSYSNKQNIQSLLVDENGLLYLGLSEANGPAIVTLDMNTSEVNPFYEPVLFAPASRMVWGTQNYIYCVRELTDGVDIVSNEVKRIAQLLDSAPYYGRD